MDMSVFTDSEVMDQISILRTEIDKAVNNPSSNERFLKGLQTELREWTDELEGRESTPSIVSQSIFPDNAPETDIPDEKFDKSKFVTMEQFQCVVSALTKLTETVQNLQRQISNYQIGRVETIKESVSSDINQEPTTIETIKKTVSSNINQEPTTENSDGESSSSIDTTVSNQMKPIMEEIENKPISILNTAYSTSEEPKIQMLCYYHRKFGNSAKRCAKNCEHSIRHKNISKNNYERKLQRLQKQISELREENSYLRNSRKNAEYAENIATNTGKTNKNKKFKNPASQRPQKHTPIVTKQDVYSPKTSSPLDNARSNPVNNQQKNNAYRKKHNKIRSNWTTPSAAFQDTSVSENNFLRASLSSLQMQHEQLKLQLCYNPGPFHPPYNAGFLFNNFSTQKTH